MNFRSGEQNSSALISEALRKTKEYEERGLSRQEAAYLLGIDRIRQQGGNVNKKEEEKEKDLRLKTEKFGRDLDEILQLQKANETRGVTVRDKELMRKLLRRGLVITARKEDGHIGACFYIEPLVKEKELKEEKEQIYRVGGLATTSGDKKSKEAILFLINEEIEKAKNEGKKAIFKTDNEKLGMLLIEKGFIKVSFEECRKRYPEFLDAYLKDPENKKEEEYYKDKIFYILPGKEE